LHTKSTFDLLEEQSLTEFASALDHW